MRRATGVKHKGHWSEQAQASVTLPFEDRHRRRIRMVDDAGDAFMLDLPDAVQLVEGDALKLADGGLIAVHAAAEKVADLKCTDPLDTLRLAWHIGNRHTPVQVLEDGCLRIAFDHVLVQMAEGLGAVATERVGPFEPEGGAYSVGAGHGHAH